MSFLKRFFSISPQELAQNYLFVCWCERCSTESSQPDCTSEEDMSDEEIDADDWCSNLLAFCLLGLWCKRGRKYREGKRLLAENRFLCLLFLPVLFFIFSFGKDVLFLYVDLILERVDEWHLKFWVTLYQCVTKKTRKYLFGVYRLGLNLLV